MPRRQLGQLEAEVLAVLAAADDHVSVTDLRLRLSGDPAYTTVNTILFRLYKKRLVTRVRNGRQYNYRLAIDQAKLVADRMRTQLSYASDPLNALNQFVKTLSADEEQALRKVLDRQGWQG